MKTSYDYIIVGAGTAGCVLARRLSDTGRYSVLLCEHGPPDSSWILRMPAGLRSAFKPSSRYNYWYRTTPQAHLDGREIDQPRGKVLGGSSSINGMTFLRGNPRDYDDWAFRDGCDGWSWVDCLPYFRKVERFGGPADAYRAVDGMVGVKVQQQLSPLNQAFLQAGEQAGYPFTADVNGCSQEGVCRFDMSVEKGVRSSSSRSYLHSRRSGGHLDIATNTRVNRILTRGDRATGVHLVSGNSAREVLAENEVIICSGVFGSPQLLMLSGIGPEDELKRHDIELHLRADQVGRNLQDHLEIHIQVETDRPVSLNRHLQPHRMAWAGLQWFGWKGGPAAVNQCHVGAFVRSGPSQSHPNLQYHFFPVLFGDHWIPDPGKNGYRLGGGPLRPESRGSVSLVSPNPGVPLAIDPNYLGEERDRDEIREAFGIGRELLAQPAFREFHRREDLPGPKVSTASDIDRYIRQAASSSFHPCGTLRMGPDNDERSVVDLELNVRGMRQLRVVDASVIPAIPSANINACVFMIAEKAADIILGNKPPAMDLASYAGSETSDWHGRSPLPGHGTVTL